MLQKTTIAFPFSLKYNLINKIEANDIISFAYKYNELLALARLSRHWLL